LPPFHVDAAGLLLPMPLRCYAIISFRAAAGTQMPMLMRRRHLLMPRRLD